MSEVAPQAAPASRNSSFSIEAPSVQIAWDSTSLGTFKTCPRKYQYSLVLGFRARGGSVHLDFGSYYHAGLEQYDHHIAGGASHDDAVRATVLWLLEATWDRKLNRPWMSDDSYKNRFTLVRSVVWYLDQFGQDDPFTTAKLANGKPAVELSFRYPLPWQTSTGEDLWWCGHLDRVAQHNDSGELFIFDHKTSKQPLNERFFDSFDPSNQFTSYILAGKVVYGLPVKGLIINGVQVAVGFTRFQRSITYRTDDQLAEWLEGVRIATRQAEEYAAAGFWPMNEMSCGNFGGCEFREVCRKPPAAREQWLKAAYAQRIWDPLQVRGKV